MNEENRRKIVRTLAYSSCGVIVIQIGTTVQRYHTYVGVGICFLGLILISRSYFIATK